MTILSENCSTIEKDESQKEQIELSVLPDFSEVDERLLNVIFILYFFKLTKEKINAFSYKKV